MLLAIFDGAFFCLHAVGSRQDSWVSGSVSSEFLFFAARKRLRKSSLWVGGFVCDHSPFLARCLDTIVFGSNNLETIPISVDLGFTLEQSECFQRARARKFGTKNASCWVKFSGL